MRSSRPGDFFLRPLGKLARERRLRVSRRCHRPLATRAISRTQNTPGAVNSDWRGPSGEINGWA